MPTPIRFLVSCAAALVLLAPCAKADTLGLHLVSVHMPAHDFNNFNPGIYYRNDDGWTAGGFYNSLRQTSFYAGYTWQYRALGLTVGGATGYQYAVQPLLVPSLRLFSNEGFSARLAFIPRVEKRIESNVLHLTVEYSFARAPSTPETVTQLRRR
ncbi:MAG: hypothetical protein JHC40_00700 [Burkholderiales bacterium]|nr:hypothetical protein [Burkholderiales bacterium]